MSTDMHVWCANQKLVVERGMLVGMLCILMLELSFIIVAISGIRISASLISKVRSKYDGDRGWKTPSSVQLGLNNTPKRSGLCRFEVIYFHGESKERNFEPDIVDDVP